MKKIFFLINIFLFISISAKINIIKNDIENYLCNKIKNTKTEIIISNSILSSQNILNQLIQSKKKNIDLYISLNNKNFSKAYSLHNELIKNNISLFISKINFDFMILDNESIIFGNYFLSKDKYQNNPFLIESDNYDLIDKLKNITKEFKQFSSLSDTIDIYNLINSPEEFINQNLIVKCKIINITKSHKNNTYILYTNENKNNFKIVIFPDLYKEFEKQNINPMYFLNKDIIVKGYFFKHNKYGYEIILKEFKDISWK